VRESEREKERSKRERERERERVCVATHNTHSLPPPDAEKETHKRDINM